MTDNNSIQSPSDVRFHPAVEAASPPGGGPGEPASPQGEPPAPDISNDRSAIDPSDAAQAPSSEGVDVAAGSAGAVGHKSTEPQAEAASSHVAAAESKDRNHGDGNNKDDAAGGGAESDDDMGAVVVHVRYSPDDDAVAPSAVDERKTLLATAGSETKTPTHGRATSFADSVALDINDGGNNRGGGGAAAHKARSLSHWHDSRISVEMHLALYAEDLMMLAPGVVGEGKAPAGAEHESAAPGQKLSRAPSASGTTQEGSRSAPGPAASLPVEFDEDAEPDITLQHVLAGVEYLLQTRIIGNANPAAADGKIREEDDEAEDGIGEEKKEQALIKAPGLDADGMPAPLVAAPTIGVTPNGAHLDPAYLPPSTSPASGGASAHPFFYFVSLDLALCDDLVTAFCYHMRRAEQKWSLRPKASKEAIKAMQLFEGFFRYVYSFRVCVSARPSSYLRASLKVSRHLRSGDAAHRRLVVRLLLMLASECARVERWEELVDADEQPKIREMLTSSEMRKLQRQLTGQAKHEREVSTSRQASFRMSRAGPDSRDGSANHPPGKHSAAVDSFPQFYSTRHHQLLPPKGALFDVEPKRLLHMFKTDVERGLHSDEIEERQRMYGKNILPPPHEPSFLLLLWTQLKDFIILVLLAAAVVSMAIQDWEAAGVLFFVVAVNVTIGLVQEYRSHNALKALNSFAIPQAQLLRDGVITMHPASELVPGDIVQLEEGANIPADLRLLQVSQLSTIEAILTGESLPITKSTAALRGRRFLPVGDRVNMAFMSTLVSKGRATAIVVNTGATTEVGRIYSALSSSSAQTTMTPLQRKLATLGKWLVLVSMVACSLVIAIGLARDYGTEIITIGISLAVSVIPEGLVTVVTLTMALGTQRMAKQKAIVRNLPAVETLGAVTTICSDKTGTLTEGKMKTSAMWVVTHEQGAPVPAAVAGGKPSGHTLRFVTAGKGERAPMPPVVHHTGASSSDASSPPPPVATAAVGAPVNALLNESLSISNPAELPVPLQWSAMVCCMNNNATVKLEEVQDSTGKKHMEEVMVGDATEVALLRSAQQAHCGVQYWQDTFGLKRVLEFAFDSDRKRMSVILELPAAAGELQLFAGVQRPAGVSHILLSKGAPEAILTRSVSHLASSGAAHVLLPLDDAIEDTIEQEGRNMAMQGQRVLATAFRFLTPVQVDKFKADQIAANAAAEGGDAAAKAEEKSDAPSAADLSCSSAESELCFLGLAGIMDPPRVEVAAAIKEAHGAGIRVCMITGDHFDTGLSIAKQIGIFSDERGDRAMNGDALAVLTEEQLSALTPFPVVFTRVSPENKLKLVKSLQKRGEICAMTGDGVNDSPAIKQADVGIAMGLGGTEVTRQSADIILSDDNFSTIVLSVGEGRRIYDNIVKFLVYLLTCNGAEVWVMLFAVILGMPVPFLSLMLLWANIFVDIPPSLSLGLEVGELDAMNRPPRPADQNILTLRDGLIIAFDSGFMAVMLLVNYYYSYEISNHSLMYARTFSFMLLAMLHLVHSFEARSLTESMFRRDVFSSNPTLAYALLVSIGFLVLGCYLPGLSHVIELEALGATEWGIIGINLCAHILVVELRKLCLRAYNRKHAPVIAAGLVVPGAQVASAKISDEQPDGVEMAPVKTKH